jgi:hypothetical protein
MLKIVYLLWFLLKNNNNYIIILLIEEIEVYCFWFRENLVGEKVSME